MSSHALIKYDILSAANLYLRINILLKVICVVHIVNPFKFLNSPAED